MKPTINIVLSVAVGLCLIGPVSARVTGDVQESFDVRPGGLLTVESDLGSIEVDTHAVDKVFVSIRFEPNRTSRGRFEDLLEDIDVDMKQSGDDIAIRLDVRGTADRLWNSLGRYVRVRIQVTVPKEFNVDLQTSGGGISVDDLTGELTAVTSGGSLDFGRIKGSVNGKTSGGTIRLAGCEGDAEVRTSGGSIILGEILGTVMARTSGGSIEVEEVMGAIDASTSGGSISAAISKQPKEDCSLTTSGGSITIEIAEGIGVNLDASTSGGTVHTDFTVAVRGRIDSHSLRAAINDGGPDLYLRTSGGNITLRRM